MIVADIFCPNTEYYSVHSEVAKVELRELEDKRGKGARGREGTCRTLRRGWVCLIDLGIKARNLTRERKRNNLVERRKSFKFMVFFQICYNLTSLINYSGLLDVLL